MSGIRRLALGPAALLVALAQCAPAPTPGHPVSQSCTTTHCVANWSRDYQLAVGRPIIHIDYQCEGDVTFRRTPEYGINTASPAELSQMADCSARRITTASPADRPS